MSISSIGNRLEETFLSSKKRIISSVTVVILLLAIPITLSLVYQQQDIRQRAYLDLNPSTGDYSIPLGLPNAGEIVGHDPGSYSNPSAYSPGDPGGPGNSQSAAQHADQKTGDSANHPGTGDLPKGSSLPPGGAAPGGFTMNTATGNPNTGLPPGQEKGAPGSLYGDPNHGFGKDFSKEPIPIGSKTTAQGADGVRGNNSGAPLAPAPQKYCSSGGSYTGGLSYNCSGKNIEVADSRPHFGRSGVNYYTVSCEEGTACARVENSCVACMPVTPTPTPTRSPSATPAPSPQICGGDNSNSEVCACTNNSQCPLGFVCTNGRCLRSGGGNQNGPTLSLDLTLPGVGTDSARNNTPRRPTRTVAVNVFGQNGQSVKNATGSATYNNGFYKGVIDLGTLSPGAYELKVKLDNTLLKRLPGTFVVIGGHENFTPLAVNLIAGDTKGSNLVDLTDYNTILSCYGGGVCSDDKKLLADFNDDGVIDAKDLNILLRAFANRQGD